jgi:hypothetical protein
MIRIALSAALFAAACTPAHEPVTDTSLPLFGTGYRFKGDICRRVGEDDFTNQFLDDAADLVACPEDAENLGVFVIDTGAVEVARRDGYVLYSVPVR